MRVSGIIANYNGGDKVVKAIKLCLNYCSEVVFVDDRSVDGSYEKVKGIKSKKLRVFRNKRNSGASYSRNKGAKEAKFNNLLFVDNDCYFEKKEFVKLQGYDEDIIYPKIIDSNGEVYNHEEGRYLQNSVCFLVKKKDFWNIGGFDENIKIYMDDVEFFFRCYKKDFSLKYVNDSEGIHDSRKSQEIVSGNFFRNLENTTYFCLKHKRFGLSPGEFPNLLTIFANMRRSLINKDRLYGLKIEENRFRGFFKGLNSIVKGARHYFKTKKK